MFQVSTFHPAKETAYRQDCLERAETAQSWLALIGGGLYALTCVWISFRIGTPGGFAMASLGLLAFSVLLYALCQIDGFRRRAEILPFLFAVAFGAHIIYGLINEPRGGALRFAFLFSVLAIYIVLLAPTWRAACLALLTIVAIAVIGGVMVLPLHASGFPAFEAFTYTMPAILAVTLTAGALESSRREAYSARTELERRATTDDLSGVSNRAHINLLAQNEFSRARRYKEPLSFLMLEIDGLDDLQESWGENAADVVVQVFAGYCVVVMRHCDSFGRLSANRFLALLPETPGDGAHILGARMCRDLSRLDVMVEGEQLAFTVSIGITEVDSRDRWAPDVLRRAEQALEDAIEAGRCRVVLGLPPAQYDPDDEGRVAQMTPPKG